MNKHMRRYLTAAAAGSLLVAASLAGTQAWAAPAPHVGSPALGPAFGGRLYGVAATSASEVWAVGLAGCCGLILHSDGSTWTQDPVSPTGFFEGVAAGSASDAWAVGGTGWFGTDPMIYHWNGHDWTQATVPAPSAGGFLNAVAVRSATDAWAVGSTGGGPGDGAGPGEGALIYHWNGQHWRQVPGPTPGPGSQLLGVSATSARDAWAVGWTGVSSNNGTSRTLVLHWNGRTWTRVPSPSGKPGVRAALQGVVALSARNAWAAGYQHADRNRLVFIMHWNGRIWTKVHSPTPRLGSNLLGISAVSANDIWAVGQGSTNGGCSANCEPGIVHWNGRRWSVVPDPHGLSGDLNILWAVTGISARDAWAVGTSGYATTLEAQWNGHAWS
jgi:hypothetical protein